MEVICIYKEDEDKDDKEDDNKQECDKFFRPMEKFFSAKQFFYQYELLEIHDHPTNKSEEVYMDITKLIGDLGFPIVITLILIYQIDGKLDQILQEIREIKNDQ